MLDLSSSTPAGLGPRRTGDLLWMGEKLIAGECGLATRRWPLFQHSKPTRLGYIIAVGLAEFVLFTEGM